MQNQNTSVAFTFYFYVLPCPPYASVLDNASFLITNCFSAPAYIRRIYTTSQARVPAVALITIIIAEVIIEVYSSQQNSVAGGIFCAARVILFNCSTRTRLTHLMHEPHSIRSVREQVAGFGVFSGTGQIPLRVAYAYNAQMASKNRSEETYGKYQRRAVFAYSVWLLSGEKRCHDGQGVHGLPLLSALRPIPWIPSNESFMEVSWKSYWGITDYRGNPMESEFHRTATRLWG